MGPAEVPEGFDCAGEPAGLAATGPDAEFPELAMLPETGGFKLAKSKRTRVLWTFVKCPDVTAVFATAIKAVAVPTAFSSTFSTATSLFNIVRFIVFDTDVQEFERGSGVL
ncbi:MAG TPA: hypothetical protein VE954_06950, partial [Oligoflexus sp.]|uniref:hypothetical protein n=1 Tax=Oligoflexus sp. TaxID=1971216 RepID=UPI002D4D9BFC